MDMLALSVVLLFFAVVVGIALMVNHWSNARKDEKRLKRFEDDVDLMIEGYRARLTGNNRFLISENFLAEAFPEYSREDVREIWKRVIARKLVDRDELDSEMCVRK